MSALKPKKFSSEEEQQEKIQYVVVSHKSQIKKILKAESEPSVIQKSQEPLPTPPNEQVGANKAKALKNRQFIKDDRHREYPKFKEEQKRETNFKEKYEPKQENKKSQKNEREQQANKEAPRRKNQRRQYRERGQQSQKDEKRQNIQEGKKKFIQKSQSNSNKDEKYSETQRKNDKNNSYNENQKKITIRQQYQFINGEQITVQLIQNKRQAENVIFIGEKIAKDYVKIAKKLINKEDTIVIKAFGHFVSKAFLVAGLLADVTPGLKQINNPSTVAVFQFTKKSEIKTKRGMIEIQLSLNNLNKKHFGYQQAQPLEQKQTQFSKPRDKPQQRRTYKQKEDVDERELR